MSSQAFRLKNFKSFQDTGKFEIKPITVLLGKNSSGKSSLLKFFLMLKQTFENRDPGTTLILNGKYVSLGSFIDLIYGKKYQRILKFDFISKDIGNNEARFKRMFNEDFILRRRLRSAHIPEKELKTTLNILRAQFKKVKSVRISYSIKYKKGLVYLSQIELLDRKST